MTFPFNGGLDPASTPTLSTLTNPDFEDAPLSLGQLNTNSEMDPPDATTLLSNGDFATNDLTGWATLEGTPVVEARGADSMVRLSEAKIQSSAIAVPSGGASVLFDVEFTGNSKNEVKAYVYSSADSYTAETQVDVHRCAYCSEWRLNMFDATPWAGLSIKVALRDGSGTVRVDNVTLADPMVGWDTDEMWSFEYGVSDPVVHIT
ncbi:MAG: hypothetical protein RIE08_06585, partial [Acidimicrobiales bacterium]